jgi:hypothetical protein
LWDYIITIACVGTALLKILREGDLLNAIMKNFNDYGPYALSTFEDFLTDVIDLTNKKIEPDIAIGAWVMGNFIKHPLANQQLKKIVISKNKDLLKAIGNPIFYNFINFLD